MPCPLDDSPTMTMNQQTGDLSELTDEQLIERYTQGQAAAFPELMDRYRNEVFHFLVRFMGNRAAAEDVFQDAFLQVHISADTFDPSRRFKPWLFTIAANKARDYMRKRARRPASSLSAKIDSADSESQAYLDLMEADLPTPEAGAEDAELRQQVGQVVQQMPEHLREILLLAYFQRFGYAEIAEILEIPLGTVKSRLHSAVGTFANLWKSQNRDPDQA
jgi:RNA polymerase sigma-70 factor (ECF subfamily)